MQSTDTRSGFVVLLGRPSSGKSSLMNAVCGHHVSIISPVPQTTRNVIRGIVTDPRGQIIFLDTPGLHRSEKQINLRLREVALQHLEDAEAAVYLVDATRHPGDEERDLAAVIAEHDLPVVVGITKCDLPTADIPRARRFLNEAGFGDFTTVELSGLPEELKDRRRGVGTLLDRLFLLLPEGPAWYPEEFYTDQEPMFRIAEVIREQAILRARQELPHALYVEIADLEQREDTLWARAFILVERESQQGIVVGQNGRTVTAIRKDSERVLAELFPTPVRLSLQVKVKPRWRHDEALLKRLIQ
ncbi:MAG TPA: GTPase Era [Alkalispirochaeta sp.]|nr:GTPase Era [Alkalispirochaeta sp.]